MQFNLNSEAEAKKVSTSRLIGAILKDLLRSKEPYAIECNKLMAKLNNTQGGVENYD